MRGLISTALLIIGLNCAEQKFEIRNNYLGRLGNKCWIAENVTEEERPKGAYVTVYGEHYAEAAERMQLDITKCKGFYPELIERIYDDHSAR